MLPEWLWIIIIGAVLLGLMKIIFTEILTKSQHAILCKNSQKEVKDMLVENREILVEHVKLLKEHLDLKLERDILTELRKLNGKRNE